jgi:hypothetical protein
MLKQEHTRASIMTNDIKNDAATGTGRAHPGHGHPTSEPSGASPQPGRDVEDHTRQDGEHIVDDAEKSKNPNRVDRDSDRRGAGDRASDPK